jgi:MscS family membrane protein
VIQIFSAHPLVAALVVAFLPIAALAQNVPVTTAPAAPAAPEPPKDTLGRDTPRGALFGFMRAAREANGEVASLYLNTTLRGAAAQDLARQLYVVLDRRLPARLTEISDKPEGGLANPLKPDQDQIGTITTNNGPLDIVVERVNRGSAGRLWLFSRQTLEAIPDVYSEIDLVRVDRRLPGFLTKARIGGIRLFDWVAMLVLLPILYRILGGISLAMAAAARWWRGNRLARQTSRHTIPGFLRLLLLAVVTRWAVSVVDLPLIERQFWSIVAAMMLIIALAWALLRLNTFGEWYLLQRFKASGHPEMIALLRLVHRAGDALVIAIGALIVLRFFGVDPTAALAGLGIGGIAVALAAQKTLENVIGGMSIIFDKAVRVGDFLKLGDMLGTVDSIGLRSTRLRTLDRTIISVPNGQIASANIETLSARDKYWFHHFVGLRYETSATQMRTVLANLRAYLASHPTIDRADTIRVRFLRFGTFSLDIEIFAYIIAADWEQFLDTQQELLLETMAIVERAGATIALPSQTLQFAHASGPESTSAAALGAIAASTVIPPHRVVGGAS